TLCPTVFNLHVFPIDITRFSEALSKRPQNSLVIFHRLGTEKADHRHRGLLGEGRERPGRRRAADERYEIAAPHSITSSARPMRPNARSSLSAPEAPISD